MSRHFPALMLAALVLLTAACQREAPSPPGVVDPPVATGEQQDAMADDPSAPPPMARAAPAPPVAGDGPAEASAAGVRDGNVDGGISRDELPENDRLREQFDAADRDGNGSLSQAEVDQHDSETRQP